MKNLTKKITHIESIRQVNTDQIQKVCELLDWTHQQYCDHQYEEFQALIKHICIGSAREQNFLLKSGEFRGFCNNEWIRRNQVNFLPYAADLSADVLELTYDGVGKNYPYELTYGGVEYYAGVQAGDPLYLEEYLHLHSAQSIMCDADLREKFLVKIDKILSDV